MRQNHSARAAKRPREATTTLAGGHALPPALVNLWQSNTLCDAQVRVGGRTFYAHRVVLAAGSDYVAALIQDRRFADSAAPTIDLPEMCPQSFAYVLEYLYKGECEVPAEDTTLGTLLQTSLRLQVRALVDAVGAALKKRLSSDNCFAIWREADRFSQPELASAARDAAARHFEAATRSDEALRRLTAEQMGELLVLDRVAVTGEAAIFEAFVRWVNLQSPPPAEEVTTPLLRLIRFPTMPSAYYRTRVLTEPLILNHAEGQRLLLDAFVEGHYGEASPRTRPRLGYRSEHLYLVGGLGPHSLKTVERYEPTKGVWVEVTPMRTAREYVGAAALEGKVYVSGGQDDEIDLSSVERYDPSENTWTVMPPMTTPRSGHAMAALGGRIYAIGGYDGEDRLASAEVYNPITNAWALTAPLSIQRNAAGVAVLDGWLYVAGGAGGDGDEDETWRSVERYEPSANRWERVAPMATARAFFGMATLDGKVYVAGGTSGVECFASAEVYDPKIDAWAPITPLQTARAFLGMVAFEGKLYACCGKDHASNLLSSVEAYDPREGVWQHVAPTARMRRALQVVAC